MIKQIESREWIEKVEEEARISEKSKCSHLRRIGCDDNIKVYKDLSAGFEALHEIGFKHLSTQCIAIIHITNKDLEIWGADGYFSKYELYELVKIQTGSYVERCLDACLWGIDSPQMYQALSSKNVNCIIVICRVALINEHPEIYHMEIADEKGNWLIFDNFEEAENWKIQQLQQPYICDPMEVTRPRYYIWSYHGEDEDNAISERTQCQIN